MRFDSWPWKPRVDDEVDDELTFHLEMRTRELVERGMNAAAARREAERRMGNIDRVRAACRALGEGRDRHMRRVQYLSEFVQDLGFAWRQLRRNPGFALVAVLTLALGIGGSTAIFSAVYAVVMRPLPLRDPARLMVVGETVRDMPAVAGSVSAGNYVDVVAGTTTFEGIAAEQFSNVNLAEGGAPERIVGGRVTANFFDVMGAHPIAGRVFRADEDRPGHEQELMLSHRLWVRRFGESASIVGSQLRMNGTPYIVVGVMPSSFDLTTDTEDLWVPIAFTDERKAQHDEHYLTVYGRLKAGVSRQQALAELETVAARLRRDVPKDDLEVGFLLIPFTDQLVGDYRTRLLVLLGAVGVVLLIACGNVANLLLARGAARGREIAIRTALGAGQWRIVRQFLTESMVLALCATGVGLLLARTMLAAVVSWNPENIPRLEAARIDPVALAFAIAMALASSVLFGLAPALRLSKPDVHTGLRDGARGATGGGFRDRLRAGLIVGEVALSLLLLFGAGLLIRSAMALQHVNPGFNPGGVLTARIALPAASYAEPDRVVAAFQRVADAAREIPGVTEAAVTSNTPMAPGGGSNGLIPEGRPLDLKSVIQSRLRMITPDFFRAMQIPIVRGRGFTDQDRRGAPKVMIVSAAFAAEAYHGQDPIGKRVVCCESGPNGTPDWKIVIGVAGDVRTDGPSVAPAPEFYLPIAQAPPAAWEWVQRSMYIVVRTGGSPAALAQSLRSAVARIDPDLPVFDVRMMDERLADALATERFNTLLLTILGVVGLLLAASGIYGVIAYFVSQRTQEIGVRMALGATPGSVVRLILSQSLRPVAVGAAIGVVAALAASRVLTAQLFGVSRTDPLTIAAVVAVLVAVALIASVVPARRAASIEPTRALQAD
jgi:putative ABC transport system permease protein